MEPDPRGAALYKMTHHNSDPFTDSAAIAKDSSLPTRDPRGRAGLADVDPGLSYHRKN